MPTSHNYVVLRSSFGVEVVSDDLQNLEMSDAHANRPIQQEDLELRRSKQLEFLLTVLQSVDESNGNPNIIYPLLRQNLDLLDLGIIEVLKNWVTAKFAEVDRDRQESIAKDIFNFGNSIQQFQWGNKAVNMEWSIECYTLALTIFTVKEDLKNWGRIQNSLAIAYSDRIRGDRAENLEQSIECYRAALEVCTTESFPREWARIQVGLARFSIEQLQNYQVATEHLQSAYEHLLANKNDTGLLAQTMFELARCFHQTGCLGQAKIYFKDSIRLYQRLEQPTQVAAVTSALGNLELQMGAIDDARIHLQTALEFYQAAGNLDRVASIRELQKYLPEYSPEPAI
jgi:tetratricopeptide (TPR) repeat protein